MRQMPYLRRPRGLTQRLRRSVIRGLDRAAELCGALPGREHALFGLAFLFQVGKKRYTDEFTRLEQTGDEQAVRICDVLTPGAKIGYTYDFGADWEHEITLEQTIPRDPGQDYPVCVAWRGDSPVEYWSEDDPEEPEPFSLAEVNRELATLGGAEESLYPERTVALAPEHPGRLVRGGRRPAPPGSAGRNQDRGQAGQPLVQVADGEQVAQVGKLLIEDPDPAAVLRRRIPAPAGAARVGHSRTGGDDLLRAQSAVGRLTGAIHARITRLIRTHRSRERRDRVRTVGIYWHIILWNLCRLNSHGQPKRPRRRSAARPASLPVMDGE